MRHSSDFPRERSQLIVRHTDHSDVEAAGFGREVMKTCPTKIKPICGIHRSILPKSRPRRTSQTLQENFHKGLGEHRCGLEVRFLWHVNLASVVYESIG